MAPLSARSRPAEPPSYGDPSAPSWVSLDQWFLTFLMLLPFNTVPHAVATYNCKIIFVATLSPSFCCRSESSNGYLTCDPGQIEKCCPRWSLFFSQWPPLADFCGRVWCPDLGPMPVASLLFLLVLYTPNLLILQRQTCVHILEPPDILRDFSLPLPLSSILGYSQFY